MLFLNILVLLSLGLRHWTHQPGRKKNLSFTGCLSYPNLLFQARATSSVSIRLVHQPFLSGYGVLIVPAGLHGFGSNLLRPTLNILSTPFFFHIRSCDCGLWCFSWLFWKMVFSAFPAPDHLFPFFPWQRRIFALYFGCLCATFSTYLLNILIHKFRQQLPFPSSANCELLASCPRICSSRPWTSYSLFSVPVSVWVCLNTDTSGGGIHIKCSRPAWYRKLPHLPGADMPWLVF